MTAGDFNAYISAEEKRGSNFHDFGSMRSFRDFLNTCGLVDLGFSDNRFTRSRGRIQERLDRVMGNLSCRSMFPKVVVRILPSLSLDHCPLLISYNPNRNFQRRNRSFKF